MHFLSDSTPSMKFQTIIEHLNIKIHIWKGVTTEIVPKIFTFWEQSRKEVNKRRKRVKSPAWTKPLACSEYCLGLNKMMWLFQNYVFPFSFSVADFTHANRNKNRLLWCVCVSRSKTLALTGKLPASTIMFHESHWFHLSLYWS